MMAPTDDDTPVPAETEEQSSTPVVKDRPGGRRGGAAHQLDRAMRDARDLKAQMPRHRLEVDERTVRRAVRWGKAEDARSATLDEVMKQRRQVERMVKASLADLETPRPPNAAPPPPTADSGLSRQLMIWAIVFAVLVIGVMVVVAIKLL